MPITTYSELQTAIANFLNRDDLGTTAKTFIALTEAQLQRELRHWRMEKRATATLTDRYTAIPVDFVQPISLYIDGANKALDPVTQSDMQDMRFSNADAVGVPRFYSITAGEVELFPTPADGTLHMYYVGRIPPLSASNPSNWLLEEGPDAYLYGSLLQSAPYLKDDDRLVTWTALYAGAVSSLNEWSERAKWGGQRLKMRG